MCEDHQMYNVHRVCLPMLVGTVQSSYYDSFLGLKYKMTCLQFKAECYILLMIMWVCSSTINSLCRWNFTTVPQSKYYYNSDRDYENSYNCSNYSPNDGCVVGRGVIGRDYILRHEVHNI